MHVPPVGAQIVSARKDTDHLFAAAQQLEAAFLAEMLKAAGFDEARQSFGGGPERISSLPCFCKSMPRQSPGQEESD